MSWKKALLFSLLSGVILSAMVIQSANAQAPNATPPSTSPGSQPRVEPCWQVAGVSKTAMQQRRVLAQQTRQEVEAVCANSSLTIPQKRHEIQQIHQRERQEMEAIVTPAQQEAMRSCQEERNNGRTGGGHAGIAGGPCGEMPSGQKPAPQPEDETTPNDTAKPN
ncbi:MAG TPA: hypothetical protein VIH78_04990 [Terriglobales bacterium]